MAAKAVLLAQTVIYRDRLSRTPYKERPFPSGIETVMAADELAEFAGRSRHQSWDRQAWDLTTNREYLAALLTNEDYGPFEHSSATFWITGVSLNAAANLNVSGLTCTIGSHVYADPQKVGMVTPPALDHSGELSADLAEHFEDSMVLYQDIIRELVRVGFSRKQAGEAAKAVLPNCAETTVLATGSLVVWRDVIDMCTANSADPEMRALGWLLVRQLRDVAPHAFQDFPRSPLRAVEVVNDGASFEPQSA